MTTKQKRKILSTFNVKTKKGHWRNKTWD